MGRARARAGRGGRGSVPVTWPYENDRVFLAAPYCTDPRFDPDDCIAYIDAADLMEGLSASQLAEVWRQLRERGTPMGGGLAGEIILPPKTEGPS